MSTENLTMDDLKEEIDESFKTEELTWNKLEQQMEEKAALDVTVNGVVKAGVVAYVDGIRGFIPASKLSLSYVENLEDYLEKPLKVQIIEVDREKKRLVLSARELLRAAAREERKNKINSIAIGTIMEGTVETIKPYGAFINLGDGISGLVHVSQISEKRIKTPEDVLKVGDPVKVKVTALKDGKLSLSIKAAAEKPQEEKEPVVENYKLPKSEAVTTNLGSLFKNLKL